MANVNDAVADLYGSRGQEDAQSKNRRMTEHSRKWSSSGLGLDASEAEARRLEKKGTFSATMDDEAGTVTLSKDDFKAVMGKLGGHKQTAKRSQTNLIFLAFGYLAVSVGFIAVIVGLLNWRLEATKETKVVGTDLVGKTGKVARTGSVESFAQIYDIPKFDLETVSKINKFVVTLRSGKTMSFTPSMIEKEAGSHVVTITDTLTSTIRIDGNTKECIVTMADGTRHFAMGAAAVTSRRRELLVNDRDHNPRLYTKEEFYTLKQNARNLEAASADLGHATLALAITEAILDSAEFTPPADYTVARVTLSISEASSPGTLATKVWTRPDGASVVTQVNSSTGMRFIYVPKDKIYAKEVTDGAWICASDDQGHRGELPDFLDDAVTEASSKSLFIVSTDQGTTVEVLDVTFNEMPSQDDLYFPNDLECMAGTAAHDISVGNMEPEARRLHYTKKYGAEHAERILSGNTGLPQCFAAHFASQVYGETIPIAGWSINQKFHVNRQISLPWNPCIRIVGYNFGCLSDAMNQIANAIGGFAFINTHDTKAYVYKKGSTTVLAFKGSDDAEDFIHDIAEGELNNRGPSGIEEDYIWIMNNAKHGNTFLKDAACPTYVTGHSLGGWLSTRWKEASGCTATKHFSFGALATDKRSEVKVKGSRFANVHDPAVGNLNIEILGLGDRLDQYTHKVEAGSADATQGTELGPVLVHTGTGDCDCWTHQHCWNEGCGKNCNRRKCRDERRCHRCATTHKSRGHATGSKWGSRGACFDISWWHGVIPTGVNFCVGNWDYHSMDGYVNAACAGNQWNKWVNTGIRV